VGLDAASIAERVEEEVGERSEVGGRKSEVSGRQSKVEN
jgi:hypothetical protein